MKHGKEKENTNCAGEEQSQDAEQSQRQKLLGYTKAEGKNFRFEDFVVLLPCHATPRSHQPPLPKAGFPSSGRQNTTPRGNLE